jgi:uncharacterized protein DUF11
MKFPGFLRLSLPAAALAACLACSDHSDVTSSGAALARLSVDAPDSVASGQAFNVDVKSLNVGVTNIRNGVVLVTLPAPLTVNSVLPSGGTDATFDNASSGATVTWNLNTLDSNTQSTLRITTMGMLAPGEAARTVMVQASMTADGIRPGDAVAQKNIQLMP